ncbi:hypothetical protein ACO0LG_12025 [Undibacterium sp. Ji42W]|uniref:hypothetical protein n=1 Tax=Undibacterium sp. Ji42W TaxID=3413039 RepID=UPI003BF3E437
MEIEEITNLLIRIPYSIKSGPIPPLRVVNDMLIRGGIDRGMSGSLTWEPFELNDRTYSEVVSRLRQINSELIDADPPPNVLTSEQWMEWRLVQRFGGENSELSVLFNNRHAMKEKLENFERIGDQSNAMQLKIAIMGIDAQISEILASARKKN